jgi:hypothetical protein
MVINIDSHLLGCCGMYHLGPDDGRSMFLETLADNHNGTQHKSSEDCHLRETELLSNMH